MLLKDCFVGKLVREDKSWQCEVGHDKNIGHIIGVGFNSTGEVNVIVQWALEAHMPVNPCRIHPCNIEPLE